MTFTSQPDFFKEMKPGRLRFTTSNFFQPLPVVIGLGVITKSENILNCETRVANYRKQVGKQVKNLKKNDVAGYHSNSNVSYTSRFQKFDFHSPISIL